MATSKKPASTEFKIRTLQTELANERARRRLAEQERDDYRAKLVDAETAVNVQARLLSGGRTLRLDDELPF